MTFSVNGSNAAQNTTATFSAAGSYSFLVTILDSRGLTATSAVTVNVDQTLTGRPSRPERQRSSDGATQQFSVSGTDQFGNAMSVQPAFVWSVRSTVRGGTVSQTGLYTAPAFGAGSSPSPPRPPDSAAAVVTVTGGGSLLT